MLGDGRRRFPRVVVSRRVQAWVDLGEDGAGGAARSPDAGLPASLESRRARFGSAPAGKPSMVNGQADVTRRRRRPRSARGQARMRGNHLV